MFIYPERKLIFIRPSKVASTTMLEALGRGVGSIDSVYWWKHWPAKHCMHCTTPEIWSTYKKFSMMRCPFDYLVSMYRARMRKENFLPSFIADPAETEQESFERFVMSEGTKRPFALADYFCDDDHNELVDFVIRQDNLQPDFNHMMDSIGQPRIKLGHHNSANNTDYRSIYTPKAKAAAEERFGWMIDKYGYEF